MLAEILLATLFGILFGIFTGLIPGVHINLVGVTLVSLSASILGFIQPLYLVVFIVSIAISHTFIDFIPSVFLGCPDTDTELSVLPGHELLKKGHGYEAVVLTAYGSLGAIIILIFITPISIFLVSKIYIFMKSITSILLIIISGLLILLEKNKFKGLLAFLLTGALGLSVLNMNIKEPLMPLLTGLFGASMLIMSMKANTQIPEQKIIKPKINKNFFSPLIGALIASPFSSLLPGLGSGQAAIIGNTISKTDRKGFLVLLGATNTLVMGFSFVALYIVSRTRTGAAVAINELIGEPSLQILILILSVVFIVGIISFFITIFLAEHFSKKIAKVDYPRLCFITLIILAFLVFFVSGFFGLIVFTVSTITGIYCINLSVRRTHMMGCLLLPTIVFYLML